MSADNQAVLRLVVFALLFISFALAEYYRPRRMLTAEKLGRWRLNILLFLFASGLQRLVFPLAAAGAAVWAAEHHVGVFNVFAWSTTLAVLLSMIALDCALYWQHRLFHQLPWLWRLHRVHHADIDVDVSTGIRFHPLEFVVSMLIKVLLVVALGAPLIAVLCFEIALNACSLFNHSNWALPPKFEQRLRRWIITPDLHRIHHSIVPSETNSNYGFSVVLWDRLFGSFRNRASKPTVEMTLGLAEYREPIHTRSLWQVLKIPFDINKP